MDNVKLFPINAGSKSDEDLVTMWQNGTKYLDRGIADAARRLSLVFTEWDKRALGLPVSKEFVPEVSVPRALGYCVNATSKLTQSERQSILRHLYYARSVPPLHSRPYVRSWGRAASLRRFNALTSFLTGQIESHQRYKAYANAVRQWEEDLEFVVAMWFKRA